MVDESEKKIDERKEDIIKFLKEKKEWIFYCILAILVFIGTWVRTLNISKLKDITTGEYTLGPDLDPFLFLRWAQDIVANGKLFVLDSLRSVPLAEICSGAMCNPINTSSEMKLLPYMIAYLYKFLHIFSSDITVTYAAIIFPAIMFCLSIFAFFIFVRKVFSKFNKSKKNIIALIATAFYIVLPSLLSRTIAGIPEKESASYFFIFLAFYLILEAFDSKKMKKGIIYSISAGIATGLLGLIWGGVTYVTMTISGAVLLAFVLRKIELKETIYFGSWVLSFILISMPFSTRYTLTNMVSSMSTAMMFGVLLILLINEFLKKLKIKQVEKIHLPIELISIITALVLGIILGSLIIGTGFTGSLVENLLEHTIKPLDASRFGLTVAENQKPDFTSGWASSFGPSVLNVPLYFWLFFIGSIFLFYEMIKSLHKKEKFLLVFGYVLFLLGLIFSNYSSSSILNGKSTVSLIVYFGGMLIFLGIVIKVYAQRFKENKLDLFKEIDFTYLMYFVIFTMTIIGARGALRLIMVLAAITPVVVAFLIYRIVEIALKEKDELNKIVTIILAIVIIASSVFTLYAYYESTKYNAENFAPSVYTQQWQEAMSWVRNNTDKETTVFAHWWDYGYWVQSIGERATIIDGGNAITYWNYLMGRHVLTGLSENEALEFLYPHNATNLLIDSTDVGKYTAFSSIGSDENYDRFSWINTFYMDSTKTQEARNETMYVFTGTTLVDEDIVYNTENKTIFLPRKKSYLIGVLLTTQEDKFSNLEGIYYYNGVQYRIPLKFLHLSWENNTIMFKNEGINAGVFIYPAYTNGKIVPLGAGLYLSNRTISSNLARLYLFGEEGDYIKLSHTEDDYIIKILKSQGYDYGDFIDYSGSFRGPIKIWNVTYPKDIAYNPEYVQIDYPNPNVTIAKEGEY